MIEIKNLVFSYGKTPVLDNITTTLEEGRIYGLLAADEEPAYGDPVYLVISGNDAGCFAKTSTNNVAVKGVFLSGAQDGIALIELFHQAQA